MSCTIVNLSRCAYYYQPKSADDAMIISLLKSRTDKLLRWRFPKCFHQSGNWDIRGIINGFIEFIVS